MAVTSFAARSAAADWPQFRGAHGNPHVADAKLPAELDAEKHVAWKAPLPGRGISSPIIIGGRVFVTACSGHDQSRLHVLCFSAADGTRQWERTYWATGRTMTQPTISVAAPTPASDGERLFAMFSSGDLICLDLDGNLLWLRSLTRDYPNATNSLGLASSPVVVGGPGDAAANGVAGGSATLVIQLEADAQALALGIDTATGVNRWKLDRPHRANWSTPVVLHRHDGRPYVALQASTGIVAVDSISGQQLWEYNQGASTTSSSAVAGGLIYAPSHGVTVLEPVEGSAAPKIKWRDNRLSPSFSSPLVMGDKVLAINGSGVLACGDAKTGQLKWRLRLDGSGKSSPVAAGDHLYWINEKGLLQAVLVGDSEGKVVGSIDVKQTIHGTPSISGDALYLRGDGELWKIARD